MNLRLDSKSIRVRVSLEEAKMLSRSGRIQESLPLPSGHLLLELTGTEQEKLSLCATGSQWINLGVPRSVLNNLLLVKESGRPSSKKALEARETVCFGSEPIELRFEIDCFTAMKNTKEGEKP